MKETTTIRRVYVVKDGQIHQEDYSIKLKYDRNLTKEENDKNTKENIETVHNAFTTAHPNLTEPKLLEISNNSPDELGRALAERELKITDAYGKETTVERLFKNSEMKDGDEVTGYEYDEAIYTLSEKELFYNWLYAKALQQNPELTKKLEEGKYDGFTDIYFNPKPKMAKKGGTVRTYTPSEAVANFVKLSKAEKIKQALENVGSYDLAMAFADIVLRRRDIEKVADEIEQGLERLEAFKEAFEKAVTTKKEYKNKENESIAPTAYAMAFVELGLSKQHIYNHKEAIFNLKDMGTAYELAKSLSGNRTIDKQVLEESVKKADQLLAEQESLGIKTVTCLDENYPESFKLTNNPPPYFFYKGNIEALKKKAIAVIGTQNVGQEGQIVKETPLNPEAKLTYIQKIGKAMGERVANNNWALVSGLNYGSDAIAQTGALEAKGTTIAISVTGLDEVYPKENTNLQEKIITENGIVISEYPIHTNTQTIKKNTEESARLKATLASGTMVVAIGKNDQAWDVLHASINQGKPVCYFDYNKQKGYNAKENIHTQGTEKIDQEAKRKAQVTQMSNPETLKEFFANCETRRQAKGELFTIGHSNHSMQDFKELLEKNQIDFLIDVRSTPYSKAQGQFNKENMQKDPVLGKKYIHIPGLGGRPQNTALADENGKVDYDKVKETKDFLQGKEIILRGIGKGQKIGIMGEAADPIDCHRAIMISHIFDGMGISAKHIMRDGQIQTQEQLNERVLDLYFPDRKQETLMPGETKTQEDQLQEAYKKRNQEIAPQIVKEQKTALNVDKTKIRPIAYAIAMESLGVSKNDIYFNRDKIYGIQNNEDAFKQARELTQNQKLEPKVVEAAIKEANDCLIKQEEQRILGVSAIDQNYPEGFKHTTNPPPYFFYKGQIEALQRKGIAVIGTRETTSFAQEKGIEVGKYIAKQGYTVISGLAKGSDTAGHLGCLSEKGTTIAIIGTQLDKLNTNIQNKILQNNGCIISEYAINTNLNYKKTLVERDRLQAGLANGVFVIATHPKSGTRHAINEAQKQGKPIAYIDFAHVPDKDKLNKYEEGMKELKEKGAIVIEPDEISGGRNMNAFLAKSNETKLTQKQPKTITEIQAKAKEMIEQKKYDLALQEISRTNIDRKIGAYDLVALGEGLNEKQKDFQDMMSKIRGSDQAGDVDIPEKSFKQVLLNPSNIPNSLKPVFKVYNEVIAKIEKGDKEGLAPKNNESLNDFMGRVEEEVGNRLKKDLLGSEKTQPRKNMYTNIVERKEVVSKPKQEILKEMYEHNVKVRVADKFQTEQTKAYVIGLKEAAQERKQKIDELAIQQAKKLTEQEVKEKMARDQEKLASLESVTQQRAETKKIWEEQIEQAALKKAGPRPEVDENTPDGKKEIEAYNFKVENLKEKEKQLTPDPTSVEIVKEAMIENVKKTLPDKIRQERKEEAQKQARDEIEKENPNLTDEKIKEQKIQERATKKIEERIQKETNWEITKIRGSKIETPEEELENLKKEIGKGPQQLSRESGLKEMSEYVKKAHIPAAGKLFLTNTNDVEIVENDHPKENYNDDLRLSYNNKKILYDFTASPIVQKYNDGEVTYISKQEMPPEVHMYIVDHESSNTKRITVPELTESNEAIPPETKAYINVLGKYADPKNLPNMEPGETRKAYQKRVNEMLYEKLAEAMPENKEKDKEAEETLEGKKKGEKIYKEQTEKNENAYALLEVKPTTQADVNKLIREANEYIDDVYFKAKEGSRDIVKRTSAEKESIIDKIISNKLVQVEYMKRATYNEQYLGPRAKQFGTPQEEAYIEATEQMTKDLKEVNELKKSTNYEKAAIELATDIEGYDGKDKQIENWQKEAANSPLNIQDNETINEYNRRIVGVILDRANKQLFDKGEGPITQEELMALRNKVEAVRQYDINKKDPNYRRNKNEKQYKSIGFIINDQKRNKGYINHKKSAPTEIYASLSENNQEIPQINAMGLVKNEDGTFNWDTLKYHKDLEVYWDPSRYTDAAMAKILNPTELAKRKDEYNKYKEYIKNKDIEKNDKYKKESQIGKTPDATSSDAYDNTGTDNYIDARNDQEVKDKEENTLNIDQYIYDQMIDTKQHPPIQTNGSPENTQHTKNLFAQRYGPNSEGARLLEIIDMGDKISENFIEARNKLNNYKEAGEKTIENMKMKVQRHKNAVASIEKQNRARSFEKYTNALGAKGFIDQYNKWENIKIKYGESNKEIPTPDEYVLAYKMEKQIEKKLITKDDLTEEEQLTYNKVQEFQKDTGLNAIGYTQMLDVVKEMENWQSVKRINRWQEAINGIINITEDKLKKTEAICNNISSEELRMAIKTIQAPTSTTDKPKIDMSKEVISEVKRIMKKTTDKTNINEEDMITIKESKEIIAQLRALEKETKAACTDLEERYLINYNGAQMNLPDYKKYLRWKEAKPDVSNIEDKEEKQKILQEYKDKCPLDRKRNPIDPTKIERIGITEVPKDTPYLQAMTIRINTLIPTTEQNVELKNNLEWQMSKLEENLEATRKWAHEKKVQEVAIYSNPQKVEIMEMATVARNRIIDATMPVILKDINAEKIVQTSSNPIDLEEMRQQAMVELTESVNRTKAKTIAQQIGKDETGLYKRTNPIESYIGDRVKEIVKNRRMADELEIGGAKNLKDIAAYNEAKTKVAEIEAAAEKEKELLRQKYKITKYDSEEEKIAKVLNVDQAIKSTKYLATTAFTKKEVERTILGEIGKKYQITKADSDKTIIGKLEKAIEETTQVIKIKNERNKTKNGEKESTTQEKEQIKVCQRMLQKIQFKDKEVASNTAYEIFEREKAPSLLEKMPGVTNKDGYVEYAKTTKNREAELQKAKNNYLKMCKDTKDALKAGKIDKTKYDEKMKDVQKEYSDSLNKIDSRIEEVKNKITKEIQNYVETCKKIENDKNEGKKTEEECETAKKEAREAHDLKMKEINITTEDIERDAIHADQFETVAHALINYAPEEIINIVNAVEINKISEDYNREIKEDNQDSLNNNNAFIGKVESNPEYLRIDMKLKKLKNEIEEQNKNMKESEGSIKAINEKIEEYNQYIKKAKKFIMTTECKLKPEYAEGKKWAKRTLASSLEPLEKYRPLKMAYTVSSPNKDMPDMHLAVDEAYRIHNEFTKGYKDLIKEPEYQNKEYTITQYIKDLSYECKSSLRAIRKPQNSSNWNKDQKDFTIEDVQNIKEMIQTNNTESFDKEINMPNSNSNDDTKTTTMMEYYENKETEYRNHEKEMAKIYESKDLQEDLRDSIQELCKNEDIARMYFVMTDPGYHKLSREEQVAALLDQKAEDLPRDPQTQLLSNECMKEAREKEKAFYSEMYEKMKEIRATKIVKDMGDKEKEALYIKGKTTSKNQLNENLTNQEKADFALLEIEIGKQLKKVGYTESYEIINKEVAKTQEQIGLEIKQGYTTPQEGMDKYLKGIPNSYTEKMINDLKEINAMTQKPSTKKEEQPEKKENKGKDKEKEKEDENTNGRGPSRR